MPSRLCPKAASGQVTALEVARTQVVERQCIVVEVARGEFALDSLLAFEQPVERLVQLILIGVTDCEQGRQGGDVPPTGRGKLAVGLEDARDHHGHHQAPDTAEDEQLRKDDLDRQEREGERDRILAESSCGSDFRRSGGMTGEETHKKRYAKPLP